ncbi:hypothetical protein DV736_g86, partial [Chaetothyriales sp. CBS 134916]
MVSFSCENCGDVLTKKKLDPHRSHCRGAVFTCLDCQTTFAGTGYRAHISCITEDQKYQGALYRDKASKASKASKATNRKSVSILEPTDQNALVPHQAYVEDVPDYEVPPPAPTPPSVDRSKPTDSVFDYMVEGGQEEDESNTPQIAFSQKTREEMSMKSNAPSVFTDSRASSRNGYRSTNERQHSQQYDELGFSYGTGPVNPRPYSQGAEVNRSLASLDFMTPSARATRLKLEQDKVTPGHARTNSGSEKKRKRDYPAPVESDTPMTDAPHHEPRTDPRSELVPAVMHSGLTGGLNKMMANDTEAFPYPQPVGPDEDAGRLERRRTERRHEKREDPTSPLKRTRHSRDDNGLGITIKGRAVKALSVVGGAFVAGQRGELTKTRRRTTSSDHIQAAAREPEGERRERKKHKVHRHNGTASANIRHEPRSNRRSSDEAAEASNRKMKVIEYRKQDEDSEDNAGNGARQMVVFGAEASLHTRCQTFLSSIPGGEVEKGYSVHKALKRWHKQCNNSRTSKHDDEQELWRWLRLKKNDQGEIVLFF